MKSILVNEITSVYDKEKLQNLINITCNQNKNVYINPEKQQEFLNMDFFVPINKVFNKDKLNKKTIESIKVNEIKNKIINLIINENINGKKIYLNVKTNEVTIKRGINFSNYEEILSIKKDENINNDNIKEYLENNNVNKKLIDIISKNKGGR